MGKRLVKCYGYCDKQYPQDQVVKYSVTGKGKGVNYCKPCYHKKVKEVYARNELIHFIQEVYNLNYPTGNMLRQIKQFVEERGYTYRNIKFTLHYIFNIKKSAKPITKYGIALVPHYYDEMIAYYKDLAQKRANTEIKETKVKKVFIKPAIPQNKYRERKMINMEDLLK